ncbi:unnamed protein product [Urochloa humidicola]
MATDAQGWWSSLPADLVNRVADCVLADNDLDYYMAMRAVCHGWRSSTADPNTSHDARFHPTRWIVLDERSFDSDTRLFVNATTGRPLRPQEPAAPPRPPLRHLDHRRLPRVGGEGAPARRAGLQSLHGLLDPFQGAHAFQVSYGC